MTPADNRSVAFSPSSCWDTLRRRSSWFRSSERIASTIFSVLPGDFLKLATFCSSTAPSGCPPQTTTRSFRPHDFELLRVQKATGSAQSPKSSPNSMDVASSSSRVGRGRGNPVQSRGGPGALREGLGRPANIQEQSLSLPLSRYTPLCRSAAPSFRSLHPPSLSFACVFCNSTAAAAAATM